MAEGSDRKQRGAGEGSPVLFVGGMGRSGTTLIERILGEAPSTCALGEVVHLWERGVVDNELCGCGERFAACPFWTAVGERAFGGWAALDARRVVALKRQIDRLRVVPRLRRRPLSGELRGQVAEYLSFYRRIYAAALEISGASLVVDSSKHASLAYCLTHDDDIDLRVLHCVRDPRAVAYSWSKTVRRPEANGFDTMTRYSPARSTLLWDAHNAALSALARQGVPTLLVRYETFVRSPEAVVKDIARFAGLAEHEFDFVRAGAVELHATHTVSGNPMRFATGPVMLRRDDAWRSSMSLSARLTVGALSLPLQRRYGYQRGAATEAMP